MSTPDRLMMPADLKAKTVKDSNRRRRLMAALRYAGFQFIVYANHEKPYAVFGPFHKEHHDPRHGFSHPLAPYKVSIGCYKRPYSALTKAQKLIDGLIDSYERISDEGKAVVNRYKERTQAQFSQRVIYHKGAL